MLSYMKQITYILTPLVLLGMLVVASPAQASSLRPNISVDTTVQADANALSGRSESAVELRARLDVEKRERDTRREEMEDARTEYEDTRQEYKDERGAFLDIRTRWNTATGEEKHALRADVTVRAKAFLDKSVATLVTKLNRIKAWVQNHPRISDEVEAEVTIKIDAEIAAIEGAVTSLESESTTLEEIQAMSARVRSRLATYHETVQEIIGKMKDSRIEHAQTKLLDIATQIEARIVYYTDLGVDLDSEREHLARVKAQVDAAGTAEEIRASFHAMQEVIAELKASVKASAEAQAEIQ
ncbi:MAG: hypothetical protein COV60_01170 [Candidatus Magasanikbacteria bacterium CG11_big_fil_rev_8_21_14_0_20_43_7]|uniref:DUF5667 domain-containing protein n=1 Tax=Candidatus Magasanikbacteria bacterium CG11_big_fil_rev_8_21_14_0_20_43_7 TaxID=1974654 RepID=A0A2H0N2Y5_9BACT|nr:MAG: hypothetical protein COV60_01170 [Candidatus Magasanikbacteria bacterium CG11_big_fil_rev_8_21_14_0_20_43_7]